jgi:predicted Rossmann fold flavoprotein
MQFDVIVIGGGPAGLMASAAAGIHGARVLLVDKGEKLGKKLAISGGGRCNVTNVKEIDELIKNIPGNGRFLYSVFPTFNNRDLMQFFIDLGVELKEEDNGRMFPVSDSAKTVVQALIRKVRDVGTTIRVHSPVKRVHYENGRVIGIELQTGENIFAPAVIIATGGIAASHTGSTGDGYRFAEAAGHTITELFPTEVPLTSNEPFIQQKRIQGLSLRNIDAHVFNEKGKKIVTHHGDILFTHFGLSGPTALRCSQFVIKQRKKTGKPTVAIAIDLFPDYKQSVLLETWWQQCKQESKKMVRNVCKQWLPERLIPLLLERANIDLTLTCAHFSYEQLTNLVACCKSFTIDINGTLPMEKAFVTGGGVHIKEIHPKTMESKLMSGLYFCGEVLDIHGYTGGYNITAASCTGYVAGKSAAEKYSDNNEA